MNFQTKPDNDEKISAAPVWMQELRMGLSVKSQFVLSGNTRDLFPTASGEFLPAFDVIWSILHANGYQALLVYDPIDGLYVHSETVPGIKEILEESGVNFSSKLFKLHELSNVVDAVKSLKEIPVALIVDYASQLSANPNELTDTERTFFMAVDKIANQTTPFDPADAHRPPFNPIFWIVDYLNKLPSWFVIDNENIRLLSVGLPDLEERFALSAKLAKNFPDYDALSPKARSKSLEVFSLETEGLSLRSMDAIARLARFEKINLSNVSEAIKAFQFGTRSDPWKSEVMQGRIQNGEEILTNRVKGQAHAVRKSLDILIRSVMGLSGAQSSSRHGRPRGVLFFAGPTGVGKTELAKAITELLFGDETAYHRFDMSEFSTEHSESRLIGAPPGYTGHDRGGELVNAARTRPFNVFLFDEIEKAHPRILDKFLQIIDEGRLTDGMGKTVNFASSIIIFTSNIGLGGGDAAMNHGLRVLPGENYYDTERKIVKAIQDHFRFTLERPELLNRIGKNIVVFEFIKGRTSILIFENMLRKILKAVEEERGVKVQLAPEAEYSLKDLCCLDLFEGGRGIGNRLETYFINPLARMLFEKGLHEGQDILIQEIVHEDYETTLIV